MKWIKFYFCPATKRQKTLISGSSKGRQRCDNSSARTCLNAFLLREAITTGCSFTTWHCGTGAVMSRDVYHEDTFINTATFNLLFKKMPERFKSPLIEEGKHQQHHHTTQQTKYLQPYVKTAVNVKVLLYQTGWRVPDRTSLEGGL